MVVIFFLLPVETALITDISLNSHWEKDFPEDPSGRFDDFDDFVKSNFDICKWIGWLLVLAQVWEAALQAVKDEEAIKPRQCEDLNNLVQESSNTVFARLEEFKRQIENFNSSKSSNYVPYKVKSSCVCFELPNSEVFITASLAFRCHVSPPCPQPRIFQTPCALCSNPGHFVSACPMAPEYPEFVQEQVNTTQGFARHNNDSYSTPYNSGWGHHPKLSWTQQAPPTNPHSYSPEFENKVLQALQRLEASTRLLNFHTPSINKLETHMSQLGDTINTSEEGNFSSQLVSNFMNEYGLGSSQEKNIYHEEVNETMTLMNEMVGETKSVDDNGDMGELITNPMGLEIEVVIEEQETSMHTSFPIEEESILHEEVRRLLCSARPVAIQTSVNPTASDQEAQLWQLAQRTTALPLGHGAFTIATTNTLLIEALRVPKLVLAGRLPAQQNAIAENKELILRCLNGEPEVLLYPNGLSEDGTVSLNTFAVSEDAKYLAYGLSSSGSDWVTIKVMRVDNKSVEPDTLSWVSVATFINFSIPMRKTIDSTKVKFSGVSWTHDGKGFFIAATQLPSKDGENVDAGTETNVNLNQEVYYHFLGTNQSEDILCWRDPDNPKYTHGASVTDDGKYLLLTIAESCEPVNKVYYCDMSALSNGLEGHRGRKDLLPFVKLIDNFDADYDVIANDDTLFTFQTNKDAPKYKLVRVDLKEPSTWREILQEAEKDVLESAVAVNDNQVLVSYLSNVKYVLQLRDLKTAALLQNLPMDIGTVSEISARREDIIAFIGFTSFLSPGIMYQCNLDTGVPDMKIFREIVVPEFDRTGFNVNQVSTSYTVSGRKNLGCVFNILFLDLFGHPTTWGLELFFLFLIANIRGGGEYGEEWHKAGSLAKKQNCFDDFISAAEFLVSAGYTQSRKLCIEGGSNGGLLIGACINQRPDLFGCALAHVGVMDMLRFHKFTIGHAWTSDFGCSEKEEFHWLIK
ncbi:hypothetical protein RHGRI_029248 [Rhododendron griersonianum]|uniref:prolyl oligopeptidase n=1 Tax=Rhododendron griersonianum TaxID=479676 RepID=A0AAV6IKT3_9ERIC|nr:hypothetical protein RHGRI_029248 [Rhododendron griersonianum]